MEFCKKDQSTSYIDGKLAVGVPSLHVVYTIPLSRVWLQRPTQDLTSPTQTGTSSLTPPLCHSKSGRPVSQNMSCFTLLYKNTYIQNLMTYALLPENSYNFQFTDLFLKSHKAFQMTCFAMVIFRERSRIWGTFTVSGLLKSFILSLQQRKEKA